MSRKLSKSHRNKISNAMKGRSLSEEQKAKLRISMKGINTWAKGRTVSQETKDKLSSIRKGKKRSPFSEETKEKMRKASFECAKKICDIIGPRIGRNEKKILDAIELVNEPNESNGI